MGLLSRLPPSSGFRQTWRSGIAVPASLAPILEELLVGLFYIVHAVKFDTHESQGDSP
jgi:hypothetical protein